MTERPRTSAGAVLFVDSHSWDAFLQFASSLRRRGVAVYRLTPTERSYARRIRDFIRGLVYEKTLPLLPTYEEDISVPVDGLGSPIAAVEAHDLFADCIRADCSLYLRTSSPQLERLLSDKLAMTEFASAIGLRVPTSWPAEHDSPIGSTFIVKPRLGCGGIGVKLVDDGPSAAKSQSEAIEQPGKYLAQEEIQGELVHFAGVAKRGQILQATTYKDLLNNSRFAPPCEVMVVKDELTYSDGRKLIEHLELTGAFCLDFIRTADGCPYLLDVNARVFGSWPALQRSGLDLVGNYMFAWDLADRPSSVTNVKEGSYPIPGSSAYFKSNGIPLARQLKVLGQYTQFLGLRWASVQGGELVLARLRKLVSRQREAGAASE